MRTATWAPVRCSTSASFASRRSRTGAGTMPATSVTRAPRNGTSFAPRAAGAASSRARLASRRRQGARPPLRTAVARRLPRCGGLTRGPGGADRGARPDRPAWPEAVRPGPRIAGCRRPGPAPARPGACRPRCDLDDLLPLAWRDEAVEAAIGPDDDAVLEQGEEDQNSAPVARAEDLLPRRRPRLARWRTRSARTSGGTRRRRRAGRANAASQPRAAPVAGRQRDPEGHGASPEVPGPPDEGGGQGPGEGAQRCRGPDGAR